MASLAELMFQQASQNIRDTKSDPSAIAKAYQAGAALAQKQEQLAMQKKQVAQAQEMAKTKGVEKVLEIYKNADKFKNEADARRYIKYGVPSAVEAYQVGDIFTPEMQEMMEGSREARDAAFMIESQVRSGNMTASEGMRALSLQGLPEYAQQARLAKAEEFAMSESGKSERSKDQIRAAQVKQQAEFEQFPVKERQKKIIADHTQFMSKGGVENINSKLKKADEALEKLDEGKVKTGTWALLATTSIPFTDKTDMIRKTNPEVAFLMDSLQGIVDVKKALDSQFSDAMADRVFSRIFDPNAPSELNIKRIKDYRQQVYKEAQESLKGYKQMGLDTGGELVRSPEDRGRQREGENQLKVDQGTIDRIKKARVENEAYKSMSNEEFYKALLSVPGMTETTARQIIRDIEIKKNPKRE